ncbi:MAG: DUF1501 domain-containing protein [Ignavibacteriota bacterium]
MAKTLETYSIATRLYALRVPGALHRRAAAALHKAGLINARAQTTSDYKAMVCIFLFGGNDANNLLIPNDSATYPNYQKLRGNLAIPQASLVSIHDAASNATYGLHPSFATIAPLYNTSKRLALMMNVGTLVQNIPRGSNGLPQLNKGGASRQSLFALRPATRLAGLYPAGRCPHRLGRPPGRQGRREFEGCRTARHYARRQCAATGRRDHAAFQRHHQQFRPGSAGYRPWRDGLAKSARPFSGATLVQAAQDSLKGAMNVAQAVNAALTGSASIGVTFPNSDIGTQLGQVAKLIQARSSLGVNRQIFFCSQNGYDTHSNQLQQQVTLYGNLSAALNAFDQGDGRAQRAEQRDPRLRSRISAAHFNRTAMPAPTTAGAATHWSWAAQSMGGALYGTYPTLGLSGPDDSSNRGTWVPSTSQDQYWARWPSGSGCRKATWITSFQSQDVWISDPGLRCSTIPGAHCTPYPDAPGQWFGRTDYAFPHLKTFWISDSGLRVGRSWRALHTISRRSGQWLGRTDYAFPHLKTLDIRPRPLSNGIPDAWPW